MSNIIINNEFTIDGKFSFSVNLNESVNPNVIEISGMLETTEYLEDISEIENDRYCLSGIRVISEGYGSEEDTIAYGFFAKDYEVKHKEGETDG